MVWCLFLFIVGSVIRNSKLLVFLVPRMAMELYLGTSVASKSPLVRAAHVGSPSVAKGKVQDISATLLGERFGDG